MMRPSHRFPRRVFAPLLKMALEASTGPVEVSFENMEFGFTVNMHRPLRDGRCWYTITDAPKAIAPYPMLAMLSNPIQAYQTYPAPLEDGNALSDLCPVVVLGDVVEACLEAGRSIGAGAWLLDRSGRPVAVKPVTFPVKFRPVTVLCALLR